MKSMSTTRIDMMKKKDDINDRPYHGLKVYYKHSMTFKILAFFGLEIVLGNLLYKNRKMIL